jgi:hypothetical protein
LTQSDLLVLTEGESDVSLLSLQFPELARATVRAVGGRVRVIREVEQLAPYELPVLGVVDRHVIRPPVPDEISGRITVWPAADIQGVYLSDDAALETMLERGFDYDDPSAILRLRFLDKQQKADVLAGNAMDFFRLRKAGVQPWEAKAQVADDPATSPAG